MKIANHFNVTVLISGRGSNLKALIENSINYKVTHVVTDIPNCLGLNYAIKNNIKNCAVHRENFSSKETFFQALIKEVELGSPNLICLAGFMRIIPQDFIQHFQDKIINIHPSLLPKFKGLNTHARALEELETKHGCTVHRVDSGVDTGELIAQKSLKIRKDDNEKTLSERVLSLEHFLYPFIVNHIAQKEVILQRDKIYFSKTARKSAEEKDIILNPKFL